ncbi:MAG: hypothetical protein G5701_02045 [Serratia symbiotica]|nr:hypothetical protein [Serratia symbiotica]
MAHEDKNDGEIIHFSIGARQFPLWAQRLWRSQDFFDVLSRFYPLSC